MAKILLDSALRFGTVPVCWVGVELDHKRRYSKDDAQSIRHLNILINIRLQWCDLMLSVLGC